MHAFFERLDSQQVAARSLVCVGLDPDPDLMPVADVFDFNRAIVDATADQVCAYKPQLAFYEAQGSAGIAALEKTVDYIRSQIPGVVIIGDAKRGDIGEVASAYATALFDTLGFDAATVNPYQGFDTIEPFLRHTGKGIFVVCRTSNPSSGQFQDLVVSNGRGETTLYGEVARAASSWDKSGQCGHRCRRHRPGRTAVPAPGTPGGHVPGPRCGRAGRGRPEGDRGGNQPFRSRPRHQLVPGNHLRLPKPGRPSRRRRVTLQ